MNTIKCAALCALMTAVGGFAEATEYFVDSERGDDARDGRSAATAWKSLAKVNAAELTGGDVVRFKRGGLWRGSLVPHSGEAGKPVTYTTYGVGVKPILQQSVDRSQPSDWFEEKPGIWSTRKFEPIVHEQVWKPSPTDAWSQSFQEGMKGTLTKITENGETFHRVVCTGQGAKLAPNFIQIWGPSLKDLPESAIIRFKIRASKPFDFKAVHVMQGNYPYTSSHATHMRTVRQIGKDWRLVEVPITATRNVLTGTPRFHLNFGDVLPVGVSVDVKLEGVWRATLESDLAIPHDVGIFIVNHGERWGVKKWNNPDWDVPQSEKWQRSVRMENDLDFCYDPEGQRVLVKYSQNPGEAFKSIELAMTRHIIAEGNKHDVVYDGLWVRYGAAHGFGGGSVSNLVIRNCDVSWIGGGLQFWRRSERTQKILYPVRFGNGIEFWGDCRNCLIERCRLWEIYDAAVTNQGRDSNETEITWRDNVIWNSEYSYEYWNRGMTRNILFEHNTCVDAGCGWAHAQRPDPNGAHLMYYHNAAATTNFVVRNNIFCRATEWTARSGLDWRYGLVHDHNLVYNEGKVPVMRWLDGKEFKLCTWADYVNLGFERHGQFAEAVFRDPARRDYRLKAGSPGQTLSTDGTPVGARNMPGLDEDQSVAQPQSVELFNGKDLTGWYKWVRGRGKDIDPKGVFTVKDGLIRISGEEWGGLVTEREYADYRLEVEYRWTGTRFGGKCKEALDSGILFHSVGKDGGFGGIWLSSHEYNLVQGASGDFWTAHADEGMYLKAEVADKPWDERGYVWKEGGREVSITGNMRICRYDISPEWTNTADVALAVNEKPIGEWNLATLECRGDQVVSFFNGKLVNKATHVKPAKGKIQLQSEGCGIEFRRVTLTPLRMKDGE